MNFTKIPQETFNQLQLNAGILLKDFDIETGTFADADILTATTGGIEVKVAPSYEDFGEDIDNCPKNTMELKKKTDADEVTVSSTSLCITKDLLMLQLGAADYIEATGAIRPRKDLKISDFKSLWWVGDMSDGGYLAVKILNALSTDGFSLKTTDKGKGNIPFTLTGHVSIDAQDVVPVEFYIASGDEDALFVTLDRTRASIVEDETLAIVATATEDATLAWSSTDTSVATVANGVVTAVAEGVCVITCKATKAGESVIATCVVTVTADESDESEG